VRGQARYVVLTSTSTLNVSIDAGGFSPSVLNVSAGTQVVWTNNSGSNQSVKSTSAPFTYDSGTLANGQTYSHYFVNPGTYNYVSQPSGLVGQVLVSSGASFTITATYTGGGVRRFSMTDTAAGTGVQLVYELVFTDWAGNVRVTDGNAITLTGGGGCASASTYCTTKMNSLFCLPAIGSTGTASASAGSGFNISASNIINNKQGLLFYGVNGQSSAPYQGGTLCVKSPTIRTPVQNSGGSPTGSDCSGVFNFDFNVRIASGVDPLLVQGVVVDSQYWSRDPADPFHTNLTNGLHFTICP
jgi:plastocyanin